MKIIYFAFESIYDPIFNSQVLIFLNKINQLLPGNDKGIKLVVFGSINDFFKKEYFKKKREILRFNNNNCFFTFKFPYLYNLNFLFGIIIFLNVLNCFITFFLFLKVKKNDRIVCHCRTEMASYILLKVKKLFYRNIKIICDCRGIGSKEILYKTDLRNRERISRQIYRIETSVYTSSDYLFCVSNKFKEYIIENSGVDSNKIKVIPCCVDIEKFKYDKVLRQSIRGAIGINNDDFVVLYSGSLNLWQLPDRMIEIFKIFKEVIEKSVFLMLTNDLNFANNLFSKYKLKKDTFYIISVQHKKIGEFLLAGDIGLLLREDNAVNRVAFPVKFSEYIRSGVPVLSSIPSDVINLIEQYGLGYKIVDLFDDSEIRKIAKIILKNLDKIKSDAYKEKISEIVSSEISWEGYLESIIRTYDILYNI